MSQLGNIQSTFGKTFTIAIANTYAKNVLQGTNLPSNTVILAVPYSDQLNEDLGIASILVTDNNGTPVMLSKPILTGNGLVYNNDKISLEIDNSSLKTNQNGELYVDFASIVRNSNEIEIGNDGKLLIDPSKAEKISNTTYGLVKVDGFTLVSENGVIHVNTENLDLATSNSFGIVKGDNRTIKIRNGIPNVVESGLDKTSATTYGLLKVDGITISSNDGVISVNNQSLVANETPGLVKVDGISITSNNGVISIDETNITKSSASSFGIVKTNVNDFSVSGDGKLSATKVTTLQASIGSLESRIQNANQSLDQIETEISQL